MKEFKGTPGPWKFNKHEAGFPHYGDIEGSYGIGEKGIENIRTIGVVTNYAGHEESNSNSKAIAAVPQLMEALQELVAFNEKNHICDEYYANDGGYAPDINQSTELTELFDKAKAALSAALD